mgnify:CR=1 FL=1
MFAILRMFDEIHSSPQCASLPNAYCNGTQKLTFFLVSLLYFVHEITVEDKIKIKISYGRTACLNGEVEEFKSNNYFKTHKLT